MILGALLLTLAMQARPASMSSEPPCGDEEQLRRGEAAPTGSPEQHRAFENAVNDCRKAEANAGTAALKTSALEMLALLYDARHLNEPAQAEMVLRELTAFAPNDLTWLFRLSRVQEDQQELDAAEATLLYARHSQPTEIDPNRMLAQFYARRVKEVLPQAAPGGAGLAPALPAGMPDTDGFYQVGGSVPAPRRLDIPMYPTEAQDSGVDGLIIVEVSLDEAGRMTGTRVLRSVPLLDEAALDAVRHWHYEPTIVDGRAAPVKLVVTVNFSLRK
jgi:TonB family protein